MPTDVRFPARDGRALAGTLFSAPSPAGTVVLASALGVPRSFYAGLAGTLAERGLTALTFDYRGIGESRDGSLRGFHAHLHEWGELDLAGAFDWMRGRHPDLPLQLLAHSVGGQLFGLLEDAPVSGAIFVGSQSGSWKMWRGLERLGMFGMWHLAMPLCAFALGYIPMKALGQGEDLPAGVGSEWALWGREDDYIWSYARPRGGLGFTRWSGPLRSYAVSDDRYAPRAGVDALVAMYTRARSEVRVLEPAALGVPRIGHFGLFKPAFRETFWSELAEGLLRATRPSAPLAPDD